MCTKKNINFERKRQSGRCVETTEDIQLWDLEIGARLKIGEEALVEVTQIGKECHNRCVIYHPVGDCVMPRQGIFTRVLQNGVIRPGDRIKTLGNQI